VHFEATSPLALASSGVGLSMATPAKSFFQSDLIGARVILPSAWAMRVPGALSWVTITGW